MYYYVFIKVIYKYLYFIVLPVKYVYIAYYCL